MESVSVERLDHLGVVASVIKDLIIPLYEFIEYSYGFPPRLRCNLFVFHSLQSLFLPNTS
jgi:hypothetical protein